MIYDLIYYSLSDHWTIKGRDQISHVKRNQKIILFTLWYFNIAIEHGHLVDLCIKYGDVQ